MYQVIDEVTEENVEELRFGVHSLLDEAHFRGDVFDEGRAVPDDEGSFGDLGTGDGTTGRRFGCHGQGLGR